MKSQTVVVDNFYEKDSINSIQAPTKNKTILVDFDETLLLRNSTAEYLNGLFCDKNHF